MPCFITVTTKPSDIRVTVNADRIHYMHKTGLGTGLVFGENGVIPSIICRETPDEILALVDQQKPRG